MDFSSSTISYGGLNCKMKNTEVEKKILFERNGVGVVDLESKNTRSLTCFGEPSPPRPRFLRYNPHRSKEILTRIQKAIEVSTTVISAVEQENQSTAEIIEEEGEDDTEEEDEEQKSGCSFKGLLKLLCLMYVLMQWSSYMSNTNSSSAVLTIGPEGEGYYWRHQNLTVKGEEWRPPFTEKTSDEILLLLQSQKSEEKEEKLQLMSEADERNGSLLDEEKITLLPKDEILNYYSEMEDLVKDDISNWVLEETVDTLEEETVDQTHKSSGDSMIDPPPADTPADFLMDDDPKHVVEEDIAEKSVGGVDVSSIINSIPMMLKAVVGFTVLSFISVAAVCYLIRIKKKKKKPTIAVRSAAITTAENKKKAATFPPRTAEEGHPSPPPRIIRAPTVELEFQPQQKKVVSKENVMPLLQHSQTTSIMVSSMNCCSRTNYEEATTNTTTLTTPIRRSTRLQNRGRTTIQSPYTAATTGSAAKSLR